MASDQKENSPFSKNDRVDCKSRRSLLCIEQYIADKIKQILDNQIEKNGNSEDIKSKLMQMYRCAMVSNIDGHVMSTEDQDLDTTTEYEPFDTGKDHYIQNVLIDRLDMQMVNTTRLRKTGPTQVRSRLKKIMRPELKYLALVNVENKCDGPTAMETDMSLRTGTVQEDIDDRLHTTKQQSLDLTQKCGDMLQKSKDLAKAIQHFKRSEDSEIQKAFCETPPHTPDCTDNKLLLNTNKLLNKKLDL